MLLWVCQGTQPAVPARALEKLPLQRMQAQVSFTDGLSCFVVQVQLAKSSQTYRSCHLRTRSGVAESISGVCISVDFYFYFPCAFHCALSLSFQRILRHFTPAAVRSQIRLPRIVHPHRSRVRDCSFHGCCGSSVRRRAQSTELKCCRNSKWRCARAAASFITQRLCVTTKHCNQLTVSVEQTNWDIMRFTAAAGPFNLHHAQPCLLPFPVTYSHVLGWRRGIPCQASTSSSPRHIPAPLFQFTATCSL